MRRALLAFALATPAFGGSALRAQGSGGVHRTSSGYRLDFDDQDVRTVLTALAEAAGTNVMFGALPAGKITLHMGAAVPRDSLVGVLRAVATANGLRLAQEGSVWRIDAPPPAPAQPFVNRFQAAQAPQLELFTYRLKHANAQELAQVLSGVFSGASFNTGVSTAFFPGAQPQPQVLTPGGFVPQTNSAARVAQQLAQQLATEGAGALSAASGGVRVVAEVSTNALIVRASQQDWQLMRRIIDAVDLRPLQVLIEVTIAEVSRTNDYNFGISGSGTRTRAGGRTQTLTSADTVGTGRDLVLRLAGAGGAVSFNVAIRALAERGDVRVLSLPIIIAQNNKQAVLNVGTQRPFVQVTQSGLANDLASRVQTIQYINVGTTLTITPIINPDGYVNLTVDQTDDAATTEVQFDAPVISKRQATTQVFLRDNQTTVIGGLSGRTRSRTRTGVPVLSSIPLIGGLFGSTQHNEDTSELFVFLTPHIVSGDDDIDRLRDALKQGSVLLKQQDLSPMITPPAADTLPAPARGTRRLPAPPPPGGATP
ncbi:hypothetical protein tb265_02180 [Gemmatimonadetes bacterium T265]|nr:hypothetical protein tb265_02180 [Gemmatimonadetes bacterium T265]